MSNPHVPLFAVATVNDDFLPETTDPDFSFNYVDISSISDFHVSDTLARFAFREAPSRARRLAQPGDIALSTVRTYLRAIAPITEHHADSVFSTGFAIIRPKPSVLNSSFLQYVALSTEFIDSIVSHSNGVSYPAINATDVMRFRIPLPPLETQQRIADYLDEETSRIDNTVRTLDELIEEMIQRRRAKIAFAVDEKNNIVKDNSTETHPVANLGLVAHAYQPETLSMEALNQSGAFPVFGANGMIGRHDNFNHEQPQVVIACRGTCGAVNWTLPKSWINGNAMVINPHSEKLRKDFLFYVLEVADYSLVITGSAQPQITRESLYRLRIPLPPLKNQQRIADYLDRETAKIDKIISTATELRSELLARRSAIITEVVMGKKKI